MELTLVLLAAGLSTRYGRPKQLEPLGPAGETLPDYAVFDASRAGVRRVLLITREELAPALRGHIEGRWPSEIEVAFHFQRLDDLPGVGEATRARLLASRKKPWGTAHALLTARPLLTGPFLVANADDFYGESAFLAAVQLAGGLEALRGEGQGGMEQSVPGTAGADRPGARAPASTIPPELLEDGSGWRGPVFGLVSYELQGTLSPHGGVSRGICRVSRRGWLEQVEEVTAIRREGGGLVGTTLLGNGVLLTGREPTSTNLWVFTPEVFSLLEEGFPLFLESILLGGGTPAAGASVPGGGGPTPEEAERESGTGSPEESGPRSRPGTATEREAERGAAGRKKGGPEPEFLIPTEVNRWLTRRLARVRVVPTGETFLGITHPPDREWVRQALASWAQEGRYPSPLWHGGSEREGASPESAPAAGEGEPKTPGPDSRKPESREPRTRAS